MGLFNRYMVDPGPWLVTKFFDAIQFFFIGGNQPHRVRKMMVQSGIENSFFQPGMKFWNMPLKKIFPGAKTAVIFQINT